MVKNWHKTKLFSINNNQQLPDILIRWAVTQLLKNVDVCPYYQIKNASYKRII